MKKKINVVFMIPNLTAGGAERVFAYVSQHLNPEKFSVKLLVMGHPGQTVYTVDRNIVIYMDKKRVLHAIPALFRFLRRKRPDIVLSSVGHLNIVTGIMALFFRRIRFIIRPTNILSNESGSLFATKCFAQVDAVICQSGDMARNFMKAYNVPLEKISVIGNPVTQTKEDYPTGDIEQTERFITVGRLSQIKGHARLLKILAQLQKKFHYTIIGDGPERENLLTLIDDLQLTDKVTHIPYTDQVNDYLLKNDLFLQGSYSEGFPNAVLESCAMGTPVLAFNVPGGTGEIIESGINGFLVDNEEEYLAVLKEDHYWKRNTIRQTVISKFGSENVIRQYEKLLETTFFPNEQVN